MSTRKHGVNVQYLYDKHASFTSRLASYIGQSMGCQHIYDHIVIFVIDGLIIQLYNELNVVGKKCQYKYVWSRGISASSMSCSLHLFP